MSEPASRAIPLAGIAAIAKRLEIGRESVAYQPAVHSLGSPVVRKSQAFPVLPPSAADVIDGQPAGTAAAGAGPAIMIEDSLPESLVVPAASRQARRRLVVLPVPFQISRARLVPGLSSFCITLLAGADDPFSLAVELV
jgi:hypothetical protein